jgi:fructan beta-fructosidase
MRMRYSFLPITLLALMSHLAKGQAAQKPDFYRPQYHFSPAKNWINDPNGLLYHNGEYHMFYQHNPFANVWGHMSWGHAVSKDLLRWEHLPLAIPEFTHPDGKTMTAIFSGSAVIDKDNTSGLCPAGTKDCMVAIYTGNVTQGDKQLAQYQNVAASSDNGRTWKQYDKNPVLDLNSKEFRDPNVFWYAPQKKWVMSAVKATEHRVAFYESKDLKNWTLLSYFGQQGDTTKVCECPALMPVPIQNEPGKTRWVLFISAGHPQKDYVGMQYFVGDFDGKNFKLDPANPKPIAPAVSNVVDWGKDYYAAIQFNNLPAGQKGPLMVGWLNNWAYGNELPTTPFKGAMSLPRQISLKRTAAGLQLMQQPIASVASLRTAGTTKPAQKVTNGSVTVEKAIDNTYELTVDIKPGSAKTVGVKLAKNGDEETIIQYVNGKLQFDRRKSGDASFSKRFATVEEAPLALQNGVIKLRIFVDKSVVEVFANDGERVITDLIFPTQSTGSVELFAEGGSAEFSNVRVSPIKAVIPQ